MKRNNLISFNARPEKLSKILTTLVTCEVVEIVRNTQLNHLPRKCSAFINSSVYLNLAY